jgi:hypothetical protein
MSDDRRRSRLPPEHQRAVLMMAIYGLSLVLGLVIVAVLLHYLG